MNNVNLIKEVDALQESKLWMCAYEKKYGISSKDFWNKNYDSKAVSIDSDDAYFWQFYIECFLDCGETLDTHDDSKECDDILEKANDTIFTTPNNELIVKNNIKKGRDVKASLPFLLRLAKNLMYSEIPTKYFSSYCWCYNNCCISRRGNNFFTFIYYSILKRHYCSTDAVW